ncbi:aspartate carbamoyltransferase catalytic subunit [Liquorilactobacillus oeni]|nr:aspartate carbamoyltransferase catalytic subunit [Liquorilactobacillus oeni]
MDSLVAMKHFVSVEDLQAAQVRSLIARASFFKNGGTVPQFSEPVYASNLFFENSTRTHCSFEMAQRKLGIQTIPFDPSSSSVSKGESLYDTLLALNSLGIQLVVIRHSKVGYYRPLINPTEHQQLKMGIINAGDGNGQHPSQSLLDMMTIFEQFGSFAGLKIVIVGDLINSRVARSNMELLHSLGAALYFSGPSCWYSPEFDAYGQYLTLDEIISEMDVVMLLRVQHERHTDENGFSTADYYEHYGMTLKRYARLKDDAIIMHPGPVNRGVEFATELVEAPKSRFTAQMKNGVFMRMAMLEAVIRGRHLGGL